MSEWIEVTASTVDAAKERALDLLGVSAEDAEFEVMADAGRQMFGLRRIDARVRARVRPTRPPPKQERSRGQRRERRGGQGSSPRRRGGTSGSRSAGAPRTATATDDQKRARSDPARPDGQEDGARRSAGDGRRQSNNRLTENAPPRDQEDAVSTEEVSMTAQAEEVGAFLEGLLDAFDLQGEVVVGEIEDDTVSVDITGQELGLLIGPRGQTMSALHELTKTVLQRSAGTGPRVRIRLDVAGYRQRRKEALAQFVRAQAAEVTASGTARALEPMNAADRKVVHDTCNELPGVATVSDGDEPRRRVIIVPAD